jgi:hypothetical protein
LRKFRLINKGNIPVAVVLSAKYGLIDINEKIADYNTVLKKRPGDEWIAVTRNRLASKLTEIRPVEIFIFGGKIYREIIEQCLNDLGERAIRIVPKGGIGQKLNALKEWLEIGISC